MTGEPHDCEGKIYLTTVCSLSVTIPDCKTGSVTMFVKARERRKRIAG